MKKGFTTFLSALKANTPPCKKGLSSRKFLSLFLILFLAVGNVWGQLTAHAPGVYEKTVAEGGYGCTMVSYDPDGAGDSPARDYEVYYFSWKSSKLYLAAGKSYVTDNTAYCLISNSGTSTTDGIDFGWGNVKCGSLSGSNTSPAAEWAVPASNSSTHYISLTNSTSLTLKVSGYDQFSFAGRDNHASTTGKQFVVTIDGVAQTFTHSATDQTVYRFDLTTGEHTIVVTGNGTGANRLRCFSLRVPSCDATAPGNISKGALVAGELTLTAEGSPADKNVWYWQSSATGEDKTLSGASRTVSAAGTYYIRSLYDDDCWSDAKSFEVKTTDLVANYTVIYKDGATELDRETVEVGNAPAGITAPTKDCYTFAGWDPALNTVSGNEGDEIEVNATWTANYSTSATLISDDVVSGKPNVNTVFAASNIVSSITFASGNYEFTSNETKKGYYGYKDKQSGDNMKILVQQGKQVQVLFGYLGSDPTITANGVAQSLDASRATGDNAENTFTYTASAADALISITMGSGTNTLKKVDIVQLYTATREDAKSDGAGSDPNIAETTLPTPTAVSGWTFTGWIANQDVKDGDETKTAGTTLPAGTYTLLANTTFTAQWMEVTGTYDITYVSDHGTAPTAENAASVVLAEITGVDSWAHKGWTANVDVTVDAATVTAGTLIANGKTAILASNVTFTAVWKEIFTVTFDSKGGSSVDPIDVEDGASLDAAPDDPTKTDYVFQGWSETDGGAVVADITALTITGNKTLYAKWALDVQVSELVFSNSFKGWINGSNIEVFYMAGESAPTIVSYEGKNLKAADAVAIVGDEVVATGSDDSEKHYTLTMTAVTPLDAAGAQTFDGTEGYVKTRHAWTSDRKWKMSKDGTDGRVARGETSMYIFLGAAESVTLDWGAQKVTDDVAVYVNGTFVKNIGKNNNSAIPLTGGKNMVALYSLQTSGDIWLNGLSVVAYVPTTGVTLKEGEDAISSKTIWESTNFTLTAVVTPDNASDKTITWTSSDDAIATVVNGVVTGVAANATPATITATTIDGVSATCVVIVTAAPAPCETPTINTQPATQAYCAGSEPTLTVDASVTDGGTLHYAWFKDDVAIGSDAATCLVDGAGTYKVVVTNHVDGKLDASVTSDNAVITLNVAAAITTQPTNKSEIVSGSSVTLSLVATNATSYQWYSCDDAEKTNAAAISGAEAADYVFTCTANGYYYCEVGNACGAAVVSNVVSVKLEPEECNVLDGTIPTAAPYIYDNSEWTLYAVTSGGKLDGSSRFKEAKDFDNSTVTVIEYSRIGMKFAKDVESLTFYATASSTGRTINKIQVTSDDITTGTPTYADVDADLASATMPGQTKQYIFTADNMLLEAGKKYWIAFSGTVDIFKICYTEALAKPTIPTLSNQELCSGESYAEIDATSTKTGEGTLSYQWYDATDEENPVAISGATDAKYTPTADGKYYVEVTNAAAGHVSNKAKSNTINVAHFASAEILSAPENVRMDAGETATLAVVATGKNVTYQWYTCDDEAGSNATEIGGATAASYEVTVGTGVQYYKVVVSSDCGSSVEAVVKVEEWTELPQANVTESITWDFSKAGTTTLEDQNDVVLANVVGIVNNANFNSQALKGSFNKLPGNYFQGTMLTFNATKAGLLNVRFTNGNTNVRTLKVYIGDPEVEIASWSYSNAAVENKFIEVPAGKVTLRSYQETSPNNVRIQKIEFLALGHRREASWIVPNELGTVCLKDECIIKGAELYELQGPDANRKLVFDEITSGELEAGKPYLFNATATGRISFYNKVNAAHTETAGSLNGMYGTFEDLTFSPATDQNIYYFSGHNIWAVKKNTADVVLPAYLCYVKMDELLASPTPDANPAPGRRRVTLGVNGQQVATGVDQVQGDEVPTKMIINGQLFILRGEKMYDAQGKLVK